MSTHVGAGKDKAWFALGFCARCGENKEMQDSTSRQEAIEKLGELIRDIRIAMLTTATPEGALHGRPMATQEAPFDGDLWFFTGASSPKVGEIEEDRHVQLSYAAPDKNTYVSVSGRASITRDKEKAKELWTPTMKTWFPGGLDDPDLALLKVRVEAAEYWDTHSSAVVHVFGFIKAVTTGKRPDPGDHEKIEF